MHANTLVKRFVRLLLVFWGLWWAIAFLTDAVTGLQHLGWIKTTWINVDNYDYLVKQLARFRLHPTLIACFFVGIIVWSLASSVCFFLAVVKPPSPSIQHSLWMHIAFMISLALWFAFFISDQIILNFDLEANHMVQGGFELLCYCWCLLSLEK